VCHPVCSREQWAVYINSCLRLHLLFRMYFNDAAFEDTVAAAFRLWNRSHVHQDSELGLVTAAS
jgi:hypothetical protein